MGPRWKTGAHVPALGCLAAGGGHPAGWEGGARHASGSAGSPFAGRLPAEARCPGTSGSRGHAAHPGTAPARGACGGCFTLTSPSGTVPPPAPHGQSPPAVKGAGLCDSSPKDSAQKHSCSKPREHVKPCKCRGSGLWLFPQSKAQCIPSLFILTCTTSRGQLWFTPNRSCLQKCLSRAHSTERSALRHQSVHLAEEKMQKSQRYVCSERLV